MALKERSKIRIDILGQEYVLKGTESPDYLKKVGDFVSNKMDQVYKINPIYGPTKIAVLASLQIADEYQKLKDDYEKIVEELRVLDKIHKIG
ncbi:MAG: cell division protein ZapA [Dehalobacterium sp.]